MRYTSKRAVEYDLELHYSLRSHYLTKVGELSEYEGFSIKPTNLKRSRSFFSKDRVSIATHMPAIAKTTKYRKLRSIVFTKKCSL